MPPAQADHERGPARPRAGGRSVDRRQGNGLSDGDELAEAGQGKGALDRALDLFCLIISDRGKSSLSELGARLGLPLSTVYRLATALQQRGLVAPAQRGHFTAGFGLLEKVSALPAEQALDQIARPVVRRLARSLRTTVHLGVLDGDMTKYLVKEQGGGAPLFTREGGLLEAYCTAVGRVLLAHLPDRAIEQYLADAPFISLTPHTVTDPGAIGEMLRQCLADGYAEDDRQSSENLHCVAVPVYGPSGRVVAALSISTVDRADWPLAQLDKLRAAAAEISERLR